MCNQTGTERELAIRVIPYLSVSAGRVVSGVNFANMIDVGDPVEVAWLCSEAGADELALIDITADSAIEVVSRTAEEVFIPLTVGGGVRNIDDARRLFRAGADKVSIGSATITDDTLLPSLADSFGSQSVVAAIDVRRSDHETGPSWEVYVDSGRRATGLDALEWAVSNVEKGAGELLVTSIGNVGKKAGYDVELYTALRRHVSVPITASGGAGTGDHMVDVVQTGHVDAVMASAAFHHGELSIAGVKKVMHEAGICVRH